jgi:hypothetical protein
MIGVDNYVCACGNRCDTDGFFPCDVAGNDCEPVLRGDWDGLYRCDRCGVVLPATVFDVVMSWSDLGDMTHKSQVFLFGWCPCEDGETVYDDCR